LQEALEVRAAFRVRDTYKKLDQSTASDNEKMNTLFAVDVVSMLGSHISYVTFKMFKDMIANLKTSCPKIKENLTLLCALLGVYELHQDNISNYETGYFKAGSG
jgi:hypothetical protein